MKIHKPQFLSHLFFIGIFPFLCMPLSGGLEEDERVMIVDIRDISSSQIEDPPRTTLEMEPMVHTTHPKDQEASQETPDPNRRLWEFLCKVYQGSEVDIYTDGPFIVVRFPEVYYPTASTRMPATLRRHLKPLSEAIQKFHSDYDLLIEGHADGGKKLAPSSGNWMVAYRRSDMVRRELLRFPVPAESIGVVSRSSGKGWTLEPSEKDRRVEFVFSPKRQTEGSPQLISGEMENQVEPEVLPASDEDHEEWISVPVIQILDARNP